MELLFKKEPEPDDSDDDRAVLGEGVFGVTYRVRNTEDRGTYCLKQIKVLKAEKNGVNMDALHGEADMMRRLNHPNIIRYFLSFNSKAGKYFNIVMEYVGGGTLSDIIQKTSAHRPELSDLMKWMIQAANALKYIHAQRMLHRDLKPDNIMITKGTRDIKIIDLGLACVVKSSIAVQSKVGASVYASFDKMIGKVYDGKDDMWAYGCIFAELLSGSSLTGAINHPNDHEIVERREELLAACDRANRSIGSVLRHLLVPLASKRLSAEAAERLLITCYGTELPGTTKKDENDDEDLMLRVFSGAAAFNPDLSRRNVGQVSSSREADAGAGSGVGDGAGAGIKIEPAALKASSWALQEFVAQYTDQFNSLQRNGFASGETVRGVLLSSGLPVQQLRVVWALADIDKDEQLDIQEFTIAMHLINCVKQRSNYTSPTITSSSSSSAADALPILSEYQKMIPPGKNVKETVTKYNQLAFAVINADLTLVTAATTANPTAINPSPSEQRQQQPPKLSTVPPPSPPSSPHSAAAQALTPPRPRDPPHPSQSLPRPSQSSTSSSKLYRSDSDIHQAVKMWVDNKSFALKHYGSISNWNTSGITSMKELFKDMKFFNDDISRWDVSNVINMSYMFYGAASFNQDLRKWNVSKVRTMFSMFREAAAFNQDLSSWNVGQVIDITYI